MPGMDWVEKLKILTNTTQPLAVSTLVSAALLGEPPQILVHDPIDDGVVSPLSPPGSLDSGYFLWSCTKVASGGLGKQSNQTLRGRGRKSFIAKAHSRARKDLLEGKQQSIESALRAVHAQKKCCR